MRYSLKLSVVQLHYMRGLQTPRMLTAHYTYNDTILRECIGQSVDLSAR